MTIYEKLEAMAVRYELKAAAIRETMTEFLDLETGKAQKRMGNRLKAAIGLREAANGNGTETERPKRSQQRGDAKAAWIDALKDGPLGVDDLRTRLKQRGHGLIGRGSMTVNGIIKTNADGMVRLTTKARKSLEDTETSK